MKKTLYFNALCVVLLLMFTAASAFAQSWSFGVISDTQWTVTDDGYNPNTVAANIIKQIDQQFIAAGVKLVVAVGDTVNNGTTDNIDTRALYAQDLYNAGIGFYPLRGNHEAAHGDPENLHSAIDMRYAFPQIVPGPAAGLNNNTPEDITTDIIPALDLANNPPADREGEPFVVGTNFSEPTEVNQANNAQSYAFQYNNATFVLLDQFDVNGDYEPSTIPDQMDWIDDVLSSRPDGTQAFIFTHKNILGGNHKDNMFGGQVTSADPGDGYGLSGLTTDQQAALDAKQAAENEFEALMQAEDVSLVISGHDHHDYLSLVTSPDGESQVHQLITQSDSSKFYTPRTPVSDNDTPIRQDLGHIGYYIFTVDGNEVTIDYYVDDSSQTPAWGVATTPFHFVKYATVSYDLDGTEQIVPQNGSYAGIQDDTAAASTMGKGFKDTSMEILAGTNSDTSTTNYGKAISKEVTTGWTIAEPGLKSDILNLGGMSLLPGQQTDEYVLAMSTGPKKGKGKPGFMRNGNFVLLTRADSGQWVNAVTENIGGITNFVAGPWNPSYTLGTYGVDPDTNTAWAILNYDGEFAIGHIDVQNN